MTSVGTENTKHSKTIRLHTNKNRIQNKWTEYKIVELKYGSDLSRLSELRKLSELSSLNSLGISHF